MYSGLNRRHLWDLNPVSARTHTGAVVTGLFATFRFVAREPCLQLRVKKVRKRRIQVDYGLLQRYGIEIF